MGRPLRRPLVLAALAGLAAAPVAATLAAPAGSTTLVSRPAGFGALAVPVTNDSGVSGASALGVDERSARVVSGDPDNRYVAFVSDADGLSADDVDTVQNVYVRDRLTGLTTLVSRASGAAGPGANGASGLPAISADGRYVAFTSSATNLTATSVSGAVPHVYVRDLVAGTTALVDRDDGQDGGVASTGATDPAVAVAGGGPVVAFASDAPNLPGGAVAGAKVYVRRGIDTILASAKDGSADPGTGDAGRPSLSADGNVVAFVSDADDLAAPGGDAAVDDVFVRNLTTQATELVSGTGATEGNGDSRAPSVSGTGARVAFSTDSGNLLLADPDTTGDVYVKVVGSPTLFLVSRADGLAGAKGTGRSGEPSINGAGTEVAFSSDAADLVPGDANQARDVFLRSGIGTAQVTTTRVSAGAGGQADGASAAPSIAPAPAGAGAPVAFETLARNMGTQDDDDFRRVYLGRPAGGAELVSRPSGADAFRSGVNASFLRSPGRPAEPVDALSADGRYTVFLSPADGLSADDDDRFVNVFRRDNLTGETILVSRADGAAGAAANGASGTEGGGIPLVTEPAGAPAISDDGNRIAFVSAASNLVPGDANPGPDVFVRDVAAGTTTLVSRRADGGSLGLAAGDPSISGDGRRVAFVTSQPLDAADANGLNADVYVRDLAAGTTTLASRIGVNGPAGDKASREPALDADGTHVAFASDATDLAPGDANAASDVFVRDLAAGTTTLVSRADGAGGAIGTGGGFAPAISAAGTRVAFASTSPGLVPAGDVNGVVQDVFVRDTAAGTTILASRTAGPTGVSGNGASGRPSLSADGTRVAFESAASDLVPGDANGLQDVLLRDLAQGTTEVVKRGAVRKSAALCSCLMLRVLTLATLFPNAAFPRLGTFVERQTVGLARYPGVELRIVSPRGLPPPPFDRIGHYAALRRLPGLGAVRAIAVSADAMADGIERARAAGFALLAVIARPIGGTLSDRIGAARVLSGCFMAVTLLAIGLAIGHLVMVPLTILCLTLAVALGLGTGAVFKLVPLWFPDRVGAVTGVVGAAGGLGGFFPPLIMGFVHTTIGSYSLGFALMALVALISLLVLRGLHHAGPAPSGA